MNAHETKGEVLDEIERSAHLLVTWVLIRCEDRAPLTPREAKWMDASERERLALWSVFYRMNPPH